MTRKSKIARLPRLIRDELNRRLENGQPGTSLVEWLNSLPEAKEILGRDFQGHRITPQNLSEWKRGGYHDWLAQQERSANLRDWLADVNELGEAASPEKLSEALFTAVTVHYAAAVQDCWIDTPENRKNLEFWGRVVRDIVPLHQCDIARQRLELSEQRMDLDRQRLELDHQRLELARQKVHAAVNRNRVPALSPALRRDAGRYPGKPSTEIVPHPERAASRTAQDPDNYGANSSPPLTETCNTEQLPSSPPLKTPAKNPLQINTLQPNPTKSNNPFFYFSANRNCRTGILPVPIFFHVGL